MPEDTAAGQTTQPDPAAVSQGDGAQPNDAGRQPADAQKPAVDVDAIAARARKKAEAERDALAARVAELESAERERAEAAMSEQERAVAEAQRAKAEADAEKAAAAQERVAALKARVIADKAPTLPAAYRALVAGDTEEAIAESLSAVEAQYQQDTTSPVQSALAELATLTPEQVAERYGDAGAALAARLQGQPVSIGGPSNAGGVAKPPPETPNYNPSGGIKAFLSLSRPKD